MPKPDWFRAILARPVAFNPALVAPCGGVTAALFLSQAIYWDDRTSDQDGWFYKSQSEWTEETALSRREQETARKHLRERGIIEEKRIGMDPTIHYRVMWDRLRELLGADISYGENAPSADGGVRQHVMAECAISIYKETETTTETTTEKAQAPSVLDALPSAYGSVCLEAYESYERMRKQKRVPPLTRESAELRAKQWSQFSPQVIKAALERSVANGWRGVFPEREVNAAPLPPKKKILTREMCAEATR